MLLVNVSWKVDKYGADDCIYTDRKQYDKQIISGISRYVQMQFDEKDLATFSLSSEL